MQNRQIHLVARPDPARGPERANFALRQAPVPALRQGEALLQTVFLSLDPYMRARMYAAGNYAASAALDAPMPGETVSRVVASENADLPVGAYCLSAHGWQEYAVSDGTGLVRVDPALAPLSTALGVLGMPGQTGYTALIRHGRPKPGETLVVSAASGAVGSVVGQTARNLGCRVVGIAGGAEKCRYLTDALGFDAAVDHRAPNMAAALAQACPAGIDIYFDNVGGKVVEAVLPLLNAKARVPVCGTVAVDRNRPGASSGPSMQALLAQVLVRQLQLTGFIYTDPDLMELAPEFRTTVSQWLRSGKLRYRETVVNGLELAPEAFLGLFEGRNFGKLLVQVSVP